MKERLIRIANANKFDRKSGVAEWKDLRFLFLRSFHAQLQRGVIALSAPLFLVLFLLKPQFKQRDMCLIWIAER
jgi:hypothetical protein